MNFVLYYCAVCFLIHTTCSYMKHIKPLIFVILLTVLTVFGCFHQRLIHNGPDDAINGFLPNSNVPIGTALTKCGLIVTRGAVGQWDAGMVESPVVWYDANRKKYGMVFTGYAWDKPPVMNYQAVSTPQIGIAWSNDLLHWEKDANNPISIASIKKSFTMKLSNAPRHFMVPISLKRSVTDMSMEFIIPTKQTSKAIIASPVWRLAAACASALDPTGKRLDVLTELKKAIPKKIPPAVMTERPKRILRLFKVISIALLRGS